jgi:hypothetical protein
MSDPESQGLLEAELHLRRDRTPSTFGKAVWQLVLGDPAGGLQTLREHYTDAQDAPSGGYHRPALALLIGEAEAAARDARSELDQPTQNWVPGWRQFRNSMLALVAGDDARAAEEVAGLQAYGATHPRLQSGPPSEVANIPAGLLAGDAGRVAEGLDTLLGWHLRSARSRTSDKFNSDTGVICLDAIVALLVAHRRGLGVRVDDRYRRAEVPLIAVYLTEWQGQPVDHGAKLSLEADLLATPWLAAHGIQLPALPAAPEVRGGRRSSKPASLGTGELDPSVVAGYLRMLVADGRGTVWQLMSWSLMVGDLDAARRHLHAGLADARRAWEETRPQRGAFLRRIWRSEELPNTNYVRQHFALALAAGDVGALRETSALLRTWMDAVQEDGRRRGQPVVGHPYGHAAGYLDLLADLLQPAGAGALRAPAETVWAGFPTVRTACVALVRRDSAMLERALNDALAEHARTLERRTSPPPLHAPAIGIDAAARRLGIPFETDARYAAYPVPIIIRDPPGSPGRMGRLPCDLMGTVLFAGAGANRAD